MLEIHSRWSTAHRRFRNGTGLRLQIVSHPSLITPVQRRICTEQERTGEGTQLPGVSGLFEGELHGKLVKDTSTVCAGQNHYGRHSHYAS